MESLSCGTGECCCCYASLYEIGKLDETNSVIKTTGGDLNVSFHHDGKKYTNIWSFLVRSSMVYAGEFEC